MTAAPPQSDVTQPGIIQWLLDTRNLWLVPVKDGPKSEMREFKTVASRALSLLPATEQASVLKYYYVKDAKMSLVSHLLKHLVVTKYCNVPWSQSQISRDDNGKPCFIPEVGTNQSRIDFNVSHQAGLVSLVAAVGFNKHVDVGTDVVCWNERLQHDYAHIDKEGFFKWVDMFADVFAESEVSYMKLSPLKMEVVVPGATITGFGNDAISRCQRRSGVVDLKVTDQAGIESVQIQCNTIIEAKLKRFYAMWCLREAYVKMTGEALLAPWLKSLEIKDVRAPEPKKDITDQQSLEEGEILKDFIILFKDGRVNDVAMELSALGKDFMVAGSVRKLPTADEACFMLGEWKLLDLEGDVLHIAESNL